MQTMQFSSEAEGFAIRVLDIEGAEWFVSRDICDVLGIKNLGNAIARLDDDEKDIREMDTLGGKQETSIINESGLYALILRSNKPKAKSFRRWVTGEVLPAIRREGAYKLVSRDSEAQAPMEHPVTLFLTCFDELARRGVSGSKAAYSIGNLFQTAVSSAVSSMRPVLPVRYPEPVAMLPGPGGERSGRVGFPAKYKPEQILEIMGQKEWRYTDLQAAVEVQTGMSKTHYDRLLRVLTMDRRVKRVGSGHGLLVAEKEGGTK